MNMPEYMRVRMYLYNLIANSDGKELQIPSENDLCRLFEVSRITVRGAIQGLVQDKYLIPRRGIGTFMNPEFWREHYKPWVKAITDHAHSKGLMVIYHGCGNVHAVIGDFAEMGIDAYNPLEVKAGMDCVDLRRKLGHTLGFCGNSDVMLWEKGDFETIRREVLRKLNAAKGGGYIFQSDHSVASDVSGKTYDTIVKLVREYGNYPLKLGAFDETI